MNYYNLYVFLSFVIGIIGILLGLMNFKLNTANIATGEKLCRNRIAGGIIWAGCLFWCVPHTEVIIFNSLVPYLYPAAVAVSILSYFFLDYLMARAFAGSLIIGGYYLVHSSFDYHSKIAILMALVGWGIGIWGIVISAKPSYLRDLMRISASKKWVKNLVSWNFIVFGLIVFCNGIAEILK